MLLWRRLWYGGSWQRTFATTMRTTTVCEVASMGLVDKAEVGQILCCGHPNALFPLEDGPQNP